MEIYKTKNNDILNVKLKGRLDTNTSVELDEALKDDVIELKVLKLELTDLDYISSAGLRVLLKYHKLLQEAKKSLSILNPKAEVMEVFDMTGFSSFLNIEE